MSYNSATRIIKMTPAKAGSYDIKFQIEDEDGAKTIERMQFKFEFSLIIEEKVKIIEKEIEEDAVGSKIVAKIDTSLNKDFEKLLNEFINEKSNLKNVTLGEEEEDET